MPSTEGEPLINQSFELELSPMTPKQLLTPRHCTKQIRNLPYLGAFGSLWVLSSCVTDGAFLGEVWDVGALRISDHSLVLPYGLGELSPCTSYFEGPHL